MSGLRNSEVATLQGVLIICKSMEMAFRTRQSVRIIVDVCIAGMSALQGCLQGGVPLYINEIP